jgi:hypothetical protein
MDSVVRAVWGSRWKLPERGVSRWLTRAVIASLGLIVLAFWLEEQLEKRARGYEAEVRARWVSVLVE